MLNQCMLYFFVKKLWQSVCNHKQFVSQPVYTIIGMWGQIITLSQVVLHYFPESLLEYWASWELGASLFQATETLAATTQSGDIQTARGRRGLATEINSHNPRPAVVKHCWASNEARTLLLSHFVSDADVMTARTRFQQLLFYRPTHLMDGEGGGVLVGISHIICARERPSSLLWTFRRWVRNKLMRFIFLIKKISHPVWKVMLV